MLGIITMAGNALRSFDAIHPAIKWGIVAIIGLLAVEFIGREAISLYVAIQTAPVEIEKQKADARAAMADAHFKCQMRGGCADDPGTPIVSPDDRPVLVAPGGPQAIERTAGQRATPAPTSLGAGTTDIDRPDAAGKCPQEQRYIINLSDGTKSCSSVNWHFGN